jgi:hypothetical protein
MADEVTPYLGLVKPEVNGEQTENVWGFDLNANFDKIDAKLASLPATDAPLDGDIYGRRQGAWSRTVMKTDFDALATSSAAVKTHDAAQDAIINGKAPLVHTHVAADITDLAEVTEDRVAALLVGGPNVTITYDDPGGKLTISSTGGGSGGGGAPLVDGDYGDITVSGTGLVWRIDPQVVSYAKIQNAAADKLLGTIAAGSVQEIDCTAAGRALLDDANAAAQRTTLGLGTAATGNTGDFQPRHTTLTGLSAMPATEGLVEQTFGAPDTYVKRLVGTSTPESIPDRQTADTRYQFRDTTLTSLAFLDGTAGLLEETGQDVFVKRAIGVGAATSIPTRADGDARWAVLDSPVFIGDARAVTPAPADNDTSIATTAFVKQTAASAIGDTPPVDVWQGRTWWESDTGKFFMSYNDGSSTQWVHLNGPVTDNYAKSEADAKFVDVAGDTMSGALAISATTASTSATTGALTVAGGVGVGGDIHAKDVFATRSATNGAYFFGSDGTRYLTNAGAQATFAGMALNIEATAASTSPTTGALTVAGGVGIGGAMWAAAANLVRSGTLGSMVDCQNSDAGAASQSSIAFKRGSSYIGTISTTNTATAYNTSSSAELKEDLQSFDAGRIVDDTEVYDFKWKDIDARSYGVIAQQAVEVYPQAITHDEDKDWWGVDYSKYVPVILQELKALRARVAELEGKPLAPKKGH